MSTTPNSMEAARARIERLVERFHTNLDSYTKAPDYCFRIGGQRKLFSHG